VAQHVSQNANDKQEVAPALQALKESTGRLPEKLSADNGYWSGDNLQALEQSGTDAYIATEKGEKTHKIPLDSSDRKLVKADFDYHEADNTFTCPEGQILTMKTRKPRRQPCLSRLIGSLRRLPAAKPLLPIC